MRQNAPESAISTALHISDLIAGSVACGWLHFGTEGNEGNEEFVRFHPFSVIGHRGGEK
jgi:hypothetical protein